MPKKKDIKSILIIGAGPIVIGQACEFDYSGTQACRALKEEGYRIILINSNPATIMTDRHLADATYLEPVTSEAVAAIIEKELPDAFLRRCFFHFIAFPDRETMERIVDVHHPNIKKSLIKEALDVFFEVREVPGLKKKPSTSELIDWLKLLMADDIPEEILKERDRSKAIPPLYGALLKNEQDVHTLQRLAFMARREAHAGR